VPAYTFGQARSERFDVALMVLISPASGALDGLLSLEMHPMLRCQSW
jgi:hypothetical protein